MRSKPSSETSLPNYLFVRLTGNKKETSEIIQEYIDIGELDEKKISDQKSSSSKKIRGLIERVNKSLDKFDRKKLYANLIEEIETIKENKSGILRVIAGGKHADGSRDLIRDARLVASEPDGNSPESYVMSYVNIARAAELLFDEAEKANPKMKYSQARRRVRERVKLASSSVIADEGISFDQNIIKHLTNELIEIVGDITDDKGNKIFINPTQAMNDAKEIVSFDSPHYHISTVTRNNKDVIVESDVMALGISSEVAEEFQNIIKGDTKSMTWFNEMREPLKTLIKTYAHNFLAGDHVSPTQLSNVVGIRNAYMKLTMLQKDGEDNLNLILESMHCGAPVFLGKGNSESISKLTAMAMKQYGQLLTADGKVNGLSFCTLNSSMGESADRRIVNYIRKVAKKIKSAFHILPLNIFRYFSISNYDAINAGIHDIAKLSKKSGYAKITEFLEKGEDRKLKYLFLFKDNHRYQEAMHELSRVADPDLRRSLKHVLEIKKLLVHPGTKKNVEIAGLIPNIEYSAKKGALCRLAKEHNCSLSNLYESIISCKSGKDRTGFIELLLSVIAAGSACDLPKEQVTELFYQMAKSGHAQAMAGRQGGTFGCHGLKGSTKEAIPGRFKKAAPSLFLATAGLNRLKKRKAKIIAIKKLGEMQKLNKIGAVLRDDSPVADFGAVTKDKSMRFAVRGLSGVEETTRRNSGTSSGTSRSTTERGK